MARLVGSFKAEFRWWFRVLPLGLFREALVGREKGRALWFGDPETNPPCLLWVGWVGNANAVGLSC